MAGEGRDGMEELIPENSTLARRIRTAASKGTLSHAAIPVSYTHLTLPTKLEV